MIFEVPEKLEASLKAKAAARGVSADRYVCELLERELAQSGDVRRPLKTSFGVLAKFGPGPSAEEIDENRAEMFGSLGAGS